MSSKINLQTCEYARKSSIFQDNQLIYNEKCLSPAKITDLREDGWKKVLEEVEEEMKGSRLETVECFVTGDVREGRGGEKWLNVVGRKK